MYISHWGNENKKEYPLYHLCRGRCTYAFLLKTAFFILIYRIGGIYCYFSVCILSGLFSYDRQLVCPELFCEVYIASNVYKSFENLIIYLLIPIVLDVSYMLDILFKQLILKWFVQWNFNRLFLSKCHFASMIHNSLWLNST